jgi:chromosome segregation ATPase
MSEVISQITENNKQIESNLNPPKENNGFEEMKNYILTLENKLKNQELENFNLKNIISQKEQEKLNYKQNIEKQENKIQELTSQLENYKFQLNKYQNKINEIENENRTLNYNVIELTQKNKSLLEKESNINNKNEVSNQHLSISNRLDEIEIIKSKLEFDNTKLINKIKDLQYEYDNQITLLTKIKNGEIEKLEKVISSLHELINNNIQQNALK